MPNLDQDQIQRLRVSDAVRKDLREFLAQLCELYREDLVSIIAFGSAVTGDYAEHGSDVNLLVVYSDLNIADLNAVSKLAQCWFQKRRFAPRFLSRRNLVQSARYFQIDWMDMRDAHLLLCGEDVLAAIEFRPADLHWQLSHEIKRMRMRIKQQFWRAQGDAAIMQRILVERFSSLLHLMRALLRLEGKPAPRSRDEIVSAASEAWKLDAAFLETLSRWKTGQEKPRQEELVAGFTRMMDLIRAVDARVDALEG